MSTRRNFLQKFSALAALSATPPFLDSAQGKTFLRSIDRVGGLSLEESIQDETFWYQVRQAYTVSSSLINLNNGGVCPQPKVVQEAVERYNRLSNETPSYYMWRVLDEGREPLRRRLADLAGCSAEEVAINRNSSEALETVIFGLRLQAGDEVVLTKQDYPNMINAWKQREKRDGIVLKWINLEFPSEDKNYIVKTFAEAFTAKTKVVHVTHLINWIGQILPVKEIAQEAHKRGIEVLVDGAHTFAHFQYSIPDLGCDYYGTSLHKWLCAPFGSGMLYVRKDKIKNLYPLLAAPDAESEDIRKFENLGTRSFAIEQGINQAIDFHEMIGGERKEKRLHYLKNYWAEKVNKLPKVQVKTSLKPEFGCAIGMLAIDGKKPGEVADFFYRNFKIHSVAIEWENIKGVRLTPNVYTTTRELDTLVTAIQQLSKQA
ncbi:MAG TPA: aminotransferase class V-fold PLP-dependent enzyme [Haliscomenobacter sp.]|uniref:Isopenicillin-N epimerase n=1 Tax=Haliscomenobacter hydrossis (strain ATCC 27775 / DSM 1100 / LMG 10767 / O) TaxID=760192 RepID=F4L7E5_HALH1|nr:MULTISPECIES: aminotransferase class V-fold PLP-dependent enzyme [Haliscomenobacter]AEE54125.1 Isopenicillin-N epimerase [Haliscomenobacter hydrossis DSM 1100]HOY15947.1 aminotransferase class V-fold PLP-dependent enzyme [Haliscomenobacter sp.]HPH19805.1 aminotransferase class V-fold PLP-dependent enzyme [Haliscomenobacter sp.]